MAEHAFDHEQPPEGGNGESPQPAAENSSLSRDHLRMMSLIFTRTTERGGPGTREGYASLDSLREASGLSARRVWEIVDHLQELDLVSCIWDSRALKDSASSAQDSQKNNSGDQRFLRGTQVRLTDEGRSYPPLLEFRSQREHKQERGAKPSRSSGSSGPAANRRRDRRRDSAWQDQPETPPQEPQDSQPPQRVRQPVSGPERPQDSQHPQQQPPRGYHVFRPRERAARRLVFLVCAVCVALLVAVIFSVLALT